MFQRDYLLKQIAQFTEAIAKIMGMKDEGRTAEALGFATDSLRYDSTAKTVDNWAAAFGPDPIPDGVPHDLLDAIAKLMVQRADLLTAEGKPEEAGQEKAKALFILLRSLQSEPQLLKLKEERLALDLWDEIKDREVRPELAQLIQDYFGK